MATELFNLTVPRRTCANRHKVPVRQWRKWNDRERSVFNAVYGQLRANQDVVTHPKTTIPKAQWDTVAWNAAWIAADEAKLACR